MGLDNAGKTSIILSIAREYDPTKIKPTFGLHRSTIDVLGLSIFQLDFGGQKTYRKDYLTVESTNLIETDLLLFVIDIQDQDRYEEAFQYYSEIIKFCNENNIDLKVGFFLHKADPDYINTAVGEKTLRRLMNIILEKIEQSNVSFFITTIYDRKNLIYAFSKSLMLLFPEPMSISRLLQSLITEQKLEAAFLFDPNFILVGSALTENAEKSVIIEQNFNKIIFLFEGAVEASEMGYETLLNLRKREEESEFHFIFHKVHLRTLNFYLILVETKSVNLEETLKKLEMEFQKIHSDFKAD